jgi:hypothetical protein
MGTLIFLGVFWGIPMYLVDRRARHNYHSPGRRLFIAVLMIWWGLIIPAVIAFALAGPQPPRGSRGLLASYDREPRRYTYEPDYDRASRANAKRYREHQQARAKRLRAEAEARKSQQPAAEKRTAEMEALTLRARRESQQQGALQKKEREQRESRERTERQDRAAQERQDREQRERRQRTERQAQADQAKQQQDDLFMTWDERGEEELAE